MSNLGPSTQETGQGEDEDGPEYVTEGKNLYF